MENLERYKHLNKYLKDKFGERTLKICIDGGFSCPNRDGSISNGGCIFCSERGSGDHIKFCSNSHTIENFISDQVKNYFTTYKAERANKFIAYFQNFTNTYDSISNLKLKYDSALIDNRIVWVELGLQTSNDETGKLINRGYSSQQFSKAVDLLNKYNIDVVTHIMVGLPNESFYDIKNTIDFINNHNIQGLKIHCTYVVENTVLASMYYNGTYTPISLEYYLECAGYILSHINPNIVIHRVSGDAPKDLLVAPDWNSHKKWIMNGLDKYLRDNDLWQGKYYI